jgi:RND family efflux transporter MFP subunit
MKNHGKDLASSGNGISRRVTIGLVAWILIMLLHLPLFAEKTITVSGLTEPLKDVTLSLEVGGRIATVFFKEGEHLAKGNPILELNKKLEELDAKRRKLVWESKVEVNSASDRAKTLKSLLESTRTLFETMGSVSKEELETKEMEYNLAQAEYERLAIAEERERIEYEMALESLDKLILKSPIQGIVTELFLDEGENCEPHQPLVHVVDTSKCRLVCNIEATLGQHLKKNQTVDLEIPVGSQTARRKGKVIFISPVVDSASGLLTVKVEFQNPDGSIRPGVAASMTIPVP